MRPEPRTILVIDRGYNDYEWFTEMTVEGVFFVTRMKTNTVYAVEADCEVAERGSVLRDQIISLPALRKGSEEPVLFRRIEYWNKLRFDFSSLGCHALAGSQHRPWTARHQRFRSRGHSVLALDNRAFTKMFTILRPSSEGWLITTTTTTEKETQPGARESHSRPTCRYVALAYADGLPVEGRFGDQIMYTLADERVMYVPPVV